MPRLFYIDAEVTFVDSMEGGRKYPLHLDHPEARYRPHIVINDIYLGVEFQPQDLTIHPGDKAKVRLGLMFYPAREYDVVQPGATFTIREGAKVIGYGRVVSPIFEM